jgi:hypothetical protein
MDNGKAIFSRSEIYQYALKHGFYAVSIDACTTLNKCLRAPLKIAMYVGLYEADKKNGTAHITHDCIPSIRKQITLYIPPRNV